MHLHALGTELPFSAAPSIYIYIAGLQEETCRAAKKVPCTSTLCGLRLPLSASILVALEASTSTFISLQHKPPMHRQLKGSSPSPSPPSPSLSNMKRHRRRHCWPPCRTTYQFHPQAPPWVTGVVDLAIPLDGLCTTLHASKYGPSQSALFGGACGLGMWGWYLFFDSLCMSTPSQWHGTNGQSRAEQSSQASVSVGSESLPQQGLPRCVQHAPCRQRPADADTLLRSRYTSASRGGPPIDDICSANLPCPTPRRQKHAPLRIPR